VNATSEAGGRTLEDVARDWLDGAPAFWDLVSRCMEERGIGDLEELHRHFLASDVGGYVPIPGRHSDKDVPLEEFRLHATGRYPEAYPTVAVGLAEIFGLDLHSDETMELCRSYMFGRTSWGIHPETPWPEGGES
jgi:hypothetical protein